MVTTRRPQVGDKQGAIDEYRRAVLMFPVLVFMHVRLARREEREALAEFAEGYRAYMRWVPAFIPKIPTDISTGQASPPARAGDRGTHTS